MKSHRVTVHGRQSHNLLGWCAVPLQTFFRGNLLKYFTAPSNSSISPPLTPPPSADPSPPPTQQDTFLFHHYIASTSNSISTTQPTHDLWKLTIPNLATHHPFLTHGILSCSSLHLAHLNPRQSPHYNLLSRTHQDAALPLFRAALASLNPKTCAAVFAFCHLLAICYFTSFSFSQDLTGAEGDELTDWLTFIHAGCVAQPNILSLAADSPVHILAEAWADHNVHPYPVLQRILTAIPNSWTPEVYLVYRENAALLSAAFSSAEILGDGFTLWHALSAWPMKMSDAYMTLLKERHTAALILMAHYCVLLRRFESCWFFEGRAERLLTVTKSCLDERWYQFL